MEQINNPPLTPKDATKATQDQRDIQEKLEHQDADPEAPAGIKPDTTSPMRRSRL